MKQCSEFIADSGSSNTVPNALRVYTHSHYTIHFRRINCSVSSRECVTFQMGKLNSHVCHITVNITRAHGIRLQRSLESRGHGRQTQNYYPVYESQPPKCRCLDNTSVASGAVKLQLFHRIQFKCLIN